MKAIYVKYELEPNTIDFIGHAVALYADDTYINRAADECLDRI